MKTEYFKISKESVWHLSKIITTIIITFLCYLRFVPENFAFEGVINGYLNIFEFGGIIAIVYLIYKMFYILVDHMLFEWFIRKGIFGNSGSFKNMPVHILRIGITEDTIKKIVSKNKKKMIKRDGFKEPESDWDLVVRVMKKKNDDFIKSLGGKKK